MLDPDLTNVLKRRIGAFVIDFGLVSVLAGLVFWNRIHQFTWAESDPTTGEPIWDAAQFGALNELATGFNRDFDWGNTKYVIDLSGLILTSAVGFILSLIVFVLIPANTGWSPGKKAFRLSVLTRDGDKPSIGAYLTRAIVGLIDLLPFVIPGLLGFLLAKSNRYHRRIGDRAAGTLVIDAGRPLRFVAADLEERRSRLRNSPDSDSSDFHSMVDLDTRLGAPGSPLDPPDVADLVESAGSDPTHDVFVDQPPGRTEETSAADLGGSDLDAVVSAPAAVVSEEAPEAVHFDQDQVPDDDRAKVDHSGWEEPVGEPAPVWHPDLSEFDEWTAGLDEQTTRASSTPAVRDRTTSARRAAVASDAPLPVLEHREPAARDRPVPESTTTEPANREPARTPASNQTTSAPRAAEPAGSAPVVGDPVWNEEWQAWLFWEPNSERWLRHDEQSGRWLPIS